MKQKSDQRCWVSSQIRATRSTLNTDFDGQAAPPTTSTTPAPEKSMSATVCRGVYPLVVFLSLAMSVQGALETSRLLIETPISFKMQVIRFAKEPYTTYERNSDKGCLLPSEKGLNLHNRQCAALGELSLVETQAHIGVRPLAKKVRGDARQNMAATNVKLEPRPTKN